MEFKEPLLPHPLLSAQPGGGGEGWCWVGSPKILLNKNVSYTSIIIKGLLKMKFLVEVPKTKKLAGIFCEAFFIFKTKSVSVMQNLFPVFSKWGSLNSIAVRIRVKYFLFYF
jgi:hypothetical protein